MYLALQTRRRTGTPNAAGFTLVELLVVMSIIGILAGMSVMAIQGAVESGKRQRARAQIEKIDQLIMEKWNSYRFRKLMVRIPGGYRPDYIARVRLDCARELMRMEMPDRLTDIIDDPISPQASIQDPAFVGGGNTIATQPIPTLLRSYRRRVTSQAASTLSYDQAEMLYLILAEMRTGDTSALSSFLSSEIGDVDGDGMNEILDPWGNPIMWLRWAPGYTKIANADLPPAEQLVAPWPILTVVTDTPQVHSGQQFPDPTDPLRIDPRWKDADTFTPFKLRPLIFSAGPDKQYDIYIDPKSTTFRYTSTTPANDPFAVTSDLAGTQWWMGTPVDANGDGLGHGDNITNHGLSLEGE